MAANTESMDQIPALLKSKIGDAAVAMRLSAPYACFESSRPDPKMLITRGV